jgi:DNA-binding transcriptional regulator YdaS (Cro superfamily)
MRSKDSISRRELRVIVDRFGGVEAFAAILPVDPRSVRYWLSGERNMRAIVVARIRSLAGAGGGG